MKSIIINSTNATEDPSIFEFTIPGSATFSEKDQIAVSSISLYYSWLNITSELNNNVFQYIFPTSGGSVTRTIVIPDGFYTLRDLNTFLQFKFIEFGDYAKNAVGENVYFIQISENQTRYAVQVDCLPVPTSAQATSLGYIQAPNGGYPASATTPQLVVLNNSFQVYLGFNAGTYPSSPQSTTYSVLSQNTPEVSHVNVVLMKCNVVNNPLALPSDVIYSFAPNAPFASVITPNINELVWNTIQKGSYEKLRVQFVNELFQPIRLLDTNVIIQLAIRTIE